MSTPGRTCRRAAGGVLIALALAATACGSGPGPLADPGASVAPRPDYPDRCAPAGVDDSGPCLGLELAAVDRARTAEGLGPLALPADFGRLGVGAQVLVALDAERVSRGLAPFAGLSVHLDAVAQAAARRGRLPAGAGPGFAPAATEWLGGAVNGLDAVYQWLYQDGPGSGVSGCGASGGAGCWADRHLVLGRLGRGTPLMGAGFAAVTPSRSGAEGGSSLALVLTTRPGGPDPLAFTWADAGRALARGRLVPLEGLGPHRAPSGVPDPPGNVAPRPDFTAICAPSGLDDSARCLDAVVAATDRARAAEGVRPLRLPADFAHLSVGEQIFVAVDAERVDRGLPPFVGLTAALDANAARGAARADDPPDAGARYVLTDGEWAGGSDNGLDAVYGWMYDDGYDSGNLDCVRRDAPGCWGHRHGILDDFGSGPWLVMGAAVDPRGDTNAGDVGGTSMAATLALDTSDPGPLLYTWAEARADTPPARAELSRRGGAGSAGGRSSARARRWARRPRR